MYGVCVRESVYVCLCVCVCVCSLTMLNKTIKADNKGTVLDWEWRIYFK